MPCILVRIVDPDKLPSITGLFLSGNLPGAVCHSPFPFFLVGDFKFVDGRQPNSRLYSQQQQQQMVFGHSLFFSHDVSGNVYDLGHALLR